MYAQAGGAAPGAKVVGHVVKMTGSASIVRNGVAIVVNTGDNVNQNDVVQTGSNSTLGLVLDDGTAFNLSANTRFMLNELTYDPNSTSNSSLMTLIQGAASFVAGQVAPTGDMKVATPLSVTAVILDISSTDGALSISVVDQQDNQVHAVQVYNPQGDLIATVTSSGSTLKLTPVAGLNAIAQESNKTPDQIAQEFNSFQQVLSTYDAAKQLFPNLPQHTENTNKNDTNPNSTKTALGSAPILPSQPPTTTVFVADVSKSGEGGGSDAISQVEGAVGAGSVNPGGNTTPSLSSLLNTNQVILVPVAPLATIEITSTGGPINHASETITGTVDAAYVGTTIMIFDTYNGVTTALGTTTVGSGGVWSKSRQQSDCSSGYHISDAATGVWAGADICRVAPSGPRHRTLSRATRTKTRLQLGRSEVAG
jgi:hypothetical protein